MKILAKPMNYGTLESAEYGAVFDLKGELYIKIKLESNNAEVIAVHLGTGNAVTLSGRCFNADRRG